jgi:hypothetical protein
MGRALDLSLAGWSFLALAVSPAVEALSLGSSRSGPRLVRSTAGTRGQLQSGVYIIEDPRTTFHYPDDPQIVVQFEWEGDPGRHHFEGRWKNPTGKAVVISEFEYEAPGRRFGGYWILNLSDATTPGLWALEAVVDGEVAGLHAFQISTEVVSADTPGPKPLSPSEIYGKALAAVVLIDKLDSQGRVLGAASGFVSGENRVLTGFQVIDGASSVRVRFSDSAARHATGIVAWDRKSNWAILSVPTGAAPALSPAKSDSFGVGDRCFVLDSPDTSTRVIREGLIIGRQSFPYAGERLSLDIFLDNRATGSPIFDEYGFVIAIVTRGDLVPGLASLLDFHPGPGNVPYDLAAGRLGLPAAQLFTVTEPQALTSFEDLWARGQLVTPLTAHQHLGNGTLGSAIDRSDKRRPVLVGEGYEIRRFGGRVAVLLGWSPVAKFSSKVVLRVFDSDNRMVLETKPETVKLSAYEVRNSLWELGTSALSEGVYRVDAVADGLTFWRSIFRLVD